MQNGQRIEAANSNQLLGDAQSSMVHVKIFYLITELSAVPIADREVPSFRMYEVYCLFSLSSFRRRSTELCAFDLLQ